MSIKTEYLYANLGAQIIDLCAPGTERYRHTNDLTLQNFKMGVNFRF